MKNTLLKFFVVCLMTQSYAVSSFAQSAPSAADLEKIKQSIQKGATTDYMQDIEAVDQAAFDAEGSNVPAPLDMEKIEKLLLSRKITEDQYNEYVDLLESGGETAFVTNVGERARTPELEALESNPNIKNIGSISNVGELQSYSDKQVAGYGDWSFHFVYIPKGKELDKNAYKTLSARKLNTQTRPGSTMKLFSTNLAFDLGSYPIEMMKGLLQHSRNGLADKALKSVANSPKYADYKIGSDSYLKDPALLNYKMHDTTEGKNQIIDATILKGCSIMRTAYANLDDGAKFHPVNGSGLQASGKDTDLQTNLVTARLETSLLINRILVNNSKYEKYKRLLPTPGGAGTLAARFKEGRRLANIFAKTGTLGNAKALAGFAETKSGTLVFSILGDNLQGLGVKEAMAGPIENVVFAHIKYLKDKGL